MALLCGFAMALDSAAGQFVVNDRIVSDPSVNLSNPSVDQITNSLVWQDNANNLWLAKLDPITGDINPPNGMGKLVDTNIASPSDTGNTAMFANGDGMSTVIYTRNMAGTLALGEAAQNANQVWTTLGVTNQLYRWKPEGTHSNWAGPAKEAYNFIKKNDQFIAWREVGNADSERSIGGITNKEGARWVEGENLLMMSLTVGGIKQVAMLDITQPNPVPVQATYGTEDTFNAYSWVAPEFNGPVFVAMIGNQKLGLFRKTGTGAWENFYTFSLPSQFKYVSSPEGFVWNDKSYVFVVAASVLGDDRFPYQPAGPSQIWIVGIDPAHPFFRRIDDPSKLTIKAEPEVYVTASGPQIYYGEKQPNGNWAQRIADTGLGIDWGYDNQSYSGPWASPFRDNKNCSCTPFPVGDSYQESSNFPHQINKQLVRQVAGPEGNLYAPLVFAQKGLKVGIGAYNTMSAREIFRLQANGIEPSLLTGNGLVAPNGDIFTVSNTQLARNTNGGATVWSVPIRGMAGGLQFAPDGNIIAFTFNGWFQVFDPSTGRVLSERNTAPWRAFPPQPSCNNGAAAWNCLYSSPPAVDMRGSRFYVSATSTTAAGTVQAFAYSAQSRGITLAWESGALANGTLSPTVLSADDSRVYVQSQDGKLYALNATNGAVIWKFDLGTSAMGAPVVTDFGYIAPGTRQSDSSSVNFVGLIKDKGATAQWAFKTTAFSAQSLAAVGRGNRFVMMAKRNSDNALVLLVVNPQFGIMSQTPVTIGPVPTQMTGIVIDQSGTVYAGTSGSSPYRLFNPVYATTVP